MQDIQLEGTATLSSPPKPTATARPQRPRRKNQFGLIFSAACEEMPLVVRFRYGAGRAAMLSPIAPRR